MSIFDRRVCRVCGCCDERACIGADGQPCYWVEDDLCSACAETKKQEEDVRTCPSCKQRVPRERMIWTYNRYGIPWKLVCFICRERVDEEAAQFVFDPLYAGESLEDYDVI